MSRQVVDIDERYPGLRERLGKVSDAALGLEHGITGTRVQQFRMRYEIPAFRRRRAKSTARPTFVNACFCYLRDQWREQTGKTVQELAVALGVSKASRLSEWAGGTGGRRPGWETLVQLAGLTDRQLVLHTGGVHIYHQWMPEKNIERGSRDQF